MRAWSEFLLVVLVVSDVIMSLLVYRMWSLRGNYEWAVRSPMLLTISGVTLILTNTLQLTQEILQLDGGRMPCWIALYNSYLYTLYGMPFTLRIVRLIVAYHRNYRKKWGAFVSQDKLLRLVGQSAFNSLSLAVIIQFCVPFYSSDQAKEGNCYYFREWWLFLIILSSMAGFLVFLKRKLKTVQDAFNIAGEVGTVLVLWAIIVVVYMAYYVTLSFLPEQWDRKHFSINFLLVWFQWGSIYVSWYKPLRHNLLNWWGESKVAQITGVGSTKRISPLDQEQFDGLEGGGGAAEADTLMDIVRSEHCELMVTYCQKALCGESIDFIVECERGYGDLAHTAKMARDGDIREDRSKPLPEEDELFERFQEISKQYLVSGSSDEVNIADKLRNDLVRHADRAVFERLTIEEKVHLLDTAQAEVVRMLEQNLWTKFVNSEVWKGIKQQRDSERREISQLKRMMDNSADVETQLLMMAVAKQTVGGSGIGEGSHSDPVAKKKNNNGEGSLSENVAGRKRTMAAGSVGGEQSLAENATVRKVTAIAGGAGGISSEGPLQDAAAGRKKTMIANVKMIKRAGSMTGGLNGHVASAGGAGNHLLSVNEQN